MSRKEREKVMLKKMSALFAVVILSLGLMACADDNGKMETPVINPSTNETPAIGNQETLVVDTPTESETTSNGSGNASYIVTLSALDIFQRYVKEYPNLKFEELSLERDFGKFAYNMDGYEAQKEYDFKISPEDGALLKEESENDSDFSGEITREHVEKVDSFVDKALADAGNGATIHQWSLSHDKGRVKFEIEVKLLSNDDIGYTYDVDSGDLLEKDN